ncbi:Do family serine endopeptidase [Chiayiivirga flava]|uniref:Do/DeqQ family serine protease n=1 Tax=Chiayiivirga flava TaxID=659595 RepID=A0A7W8D804_9GAMM|nr:Do family serine endopeptidase [Chiayiivirga flava]MBB5209636.1 Do/DeqQ family serine protease [Chiayiivirga flava]
MRRVLLPLALIAAAFAGGYAAQRVLPVATQDAMLAHALPAARAALPAQVDGTPLPSLAPMLERVTPAVVNIHSKTTVRVRNPYANDPLFQYFFGLPNAPQERIKQSLGSGVIIDAQAGLVLTNYHVIEDADDIQVTLADGRTLTAEVVGADEDTDVGLIRLPAQDLQAVPLANGDALRVGDFVVAVGNPFGLGQTVTSGIVSALGRSGLPGLGYQNFIQTDASINPGNSGGALVNLRGELVGINTAIFNPGGSGAGNIGIGFAIPVELARDVVRQLQDYGEVRRGSLGVETQEITPEIAQALALATRRGAVVTRVQSGSPAAAAGLRAGDVITAIDGRPVASRLDLHNAEGLLPVGKAIRIDVLREGKATSVSAALKARPKDLPGETLDPRLAGATFSELPERYRSQGVAGVLVSEVKRGSRAAANGLRAGDLISGVNQGEFADLAGMQAAFARKPTQLLLTLTRGRGSYFVPIE